MECVCLCLCVCVCLAVSCRVSGSVGNALTLTAHKSDHTPHHLLLLSVCRSETLQVVLDAASGDQADTRNKAVRLIANKLFAQPQLQESIEKFARHMLHHLTTTTPSAAATADAAALSIVKAEQPPLQTPQATAATPTETVSDPQAASQQQLQYQSEEDGTRLSGLYCALCTKKQPLLRDLLSVYGRAAAGCKTAIEAVAAGKYATVSHALKLSNALYCLIVFLTAFMPLSHASDICMSVLICVMPQQICALRIRHGVYLLKLVWACMTVALSP